MDQVLRGLKGQEVCQGVTDGVRKRGRTAVRTCPGGEATMVKGDWTGSRSENENVTGGSHSGVQESPWIAHEALHGEGKEFKKANP